MFDWRTIINAPHHKIFPWSWCFNLSHGIILEELLICWVDRALVLVCLMMTMMLVGFVWVYGRGSTFASLVWSLRYVDVVGRVVLIRRLNGAWTGVFKANVGRCGCSWRRCWLHLEQHMIFTTPSGLYTTIRPSIVIVAPANVRAGRFGVSLLWLQSWPWIWICNSPISLSQTLLEACSFLRIIHQVLLQVVGLTSLE